MNVTMQSFSYRNNFLELELQRFEMNHRTKNAVAAVLKMFIKDSVYDETSTLNSIGYYLYTMTPLEISLISDYGLDCSTILNIHDTVYRLDDLLINDLIEYFFIFFDQEFDWQEVSLEKPPLLELRRKLNTVFANHGFQYKILENNTIIPVFDSLESEEIDTVLMMPKYTEYMVNAAKQVFDQPGDSVLNCTRALERLLKSKFDLKNLPLGKLANIVKKLNVSENPVVTDLIEQLMVIVDKLNGIRSSGKKSGHDGVYEISSKDARLCVVITASIINYLT